MTQMSTDEMFESLTGYEERRIKEFFGQPILALANEDPLQLQRALAFVALLRDKKVQDQGTPRKTYGEVQKMTVGEIKAFFATAEPEVDPDNPVSAEGNDASSAD